MLRSNLSEKRRWALRFEKICLHLQGNPNNKQNDEKVFGNVDDSLLGIVRAEWLRGIGRKAQRQGAAEHG